MQFALHMVINKKYRVSLTPSKLASSKYIFSAQFANIQFYFLLLNIVGIKVSEILLYLQQKKERKENNREGHDGNSGEG